MQTQANIKKFVQTISVSTITIKMEEDLGYEPVVSPADLDYEEDLNDKDNEEEDPKKVESKTDAENAADCHPAQLNEIQVNMRRASIAYRRASLQFRRASLAQNSHDGSSHPDHPSSQSRRGSNASNSAWSAVSGLTTNSDMPPWEYDLGYGVTTTKFEDQAQQDAQAAGVGVGVVKDGGGDNDSQGTPDPWMMGEGSKRSMPKDAKSQDGTLSELSFRHRRASIEYRRASMALRRASAAGSRRSSVCGSHGTRRMSTCGSLGSSQVESAPPVIVENDTNSRRGSVCSVDSDCTDLPTGVYFGEVEILEFPLIIGTFITSWKRCVCIHLIKGTMSHTFTFFFSLAHSLHPMNNDNPHTTLYTTII